MAGFYASNADSVRDFMKNYNDEQIQGMEDMTDSVANLKDLSWKDTAEKVRSQAEGKAEEGGEILGSLLGVKGVGKGIKKLKDIYNKGKALKNKVEDLKNKVSGTEEQDNGDDVVEQTEQEKGDDVGDDVLGQDALEDENTFQTAPYQDDLDTTEPTQDIGNDVADADEGKTATVDKEKETEGGEGAEGAEGTEGGEDAIDFDNLGDVSTDTLRNFFTNQGSSFRNKIANFRKLRQSQEADDAGDTKPDLGEEGEGEKGVDLDKIFDEATGGTEEGSFQLPADAIGSTKISAPRIGEGDVEDILSRPNQAQIRQNIETEPQAETEGSGGNVFEEPQASVGGEQEFDLISNTAPTSYTEPEKMLRTTDTSYTPADGSDLSSGGLQEGGGGRTLLSEVKINPKTLDIDSPQPTQDIGFNVKPVEGVNTPTSGATSEPTSGATSEPTSGDIGFNVDPVNSTPYPKAGADVDVSSDTTTDIGGYGKDISSSLKNTADDIQQQGKNLTENIKGVYQKATGGSGGDGGGGGEEAEDLAETGAEDTGELGAEIGFDTAVSAIPVVGELAVVGTGLYEGIKGLLDLFGDDSKKPPPPKLIGGVASGGNPLSFGGSNLSSKLASSIPTAENSLDSSGIMSF